MYYSKTAALDRHVCELHRIITKVEPKAPQKNTSTENKCKMSKRELNNRIERLVLLAYTLRRKSSNEPFVPATEQEWAHLYMNGMCVKKYYTCQGRQVYVPKKITDSTGRGCDNRSGKYDTYLTDCGGKGSGSGGADNKMSEMANVIKKFNNFLNETNGNLIEKEFKKATEKDLKTFKNIEINPKFFEKGSVILTYDNLLYIILVLNVFFDELKKLETKLEDQKNRNISFPEYTRDLTPIETDLDDKLKIIEKCLDYFKDLITISEDEYENKNKDEVEMVKNIIIFFNLTEKSLTENVKPQVEILINQAKTDSKNNKSNIYKKIYADFLTNFPEEKDK